MLMPIRHHVNDKEEGPTQMLEPGPPVMRYLAKLLAGPIIQAQPKKHLNASALVG